jgi:hypothetical protein
VTNTIPSPATATIITPRIGVDFHALRVLSLGVSARDVASRLGVSPITLAAWERSWQPIEADRAVLWRKALAEAAQGRRERMECEGLARLSERPQLLCGGSCRAHQCRS